MIWIFVLGIIILAAFHRGSRKVMLWIGALGVGVFGIVLALAYMNHWQL